LAESFPSSSRSVLICGKECDVVATQALPAANTKKYRTSADSLHSVGATVQTMWCKGGRISSDKLRVRPRMTMMDSF
jgi:hypothetical protein